MSTILVTGASGFIGRHTTLKLVAAGHRVVALCRSDEAARAVVERLPEDLRHGVETRRGDVTQAATIEAALAGTDAILHLVAISRDFSGGKDLRRVNLDGTRNVIAAARAAGVRRLVHQSALGIVDDPDLAYASSKAKAERLVAESALDWTITKPSLVWGPGDGFFNVIARLGRLSPLVVPIPAGARSRFQPIWIRDVARILTTAFADPGTIGRSFELGGPRDWTYPDMVREVLRALNARRALVPVPMPLIRVVARSSELLRLPFPVSSDQLRQLRLDNVTSLDSVPAVFGFAPRDMADNLSYVRRSAREQDQRPMVADDELAAA
jgi:NADH dehydrogenase